MFNSHSIEIDCVIRLDVFIFIVTFLNIHKMYLIYLRSVCSWVFLELKPCDILFCAYVLIYVHIVVLLLEPHQHEMLIQLSFLQL